MRCASPLATIPDERMMPASIPHSFSMPTNLTHLPELLSPAGNWECARAAVANGADAIFFGMPRFNARLRADNFTEADLPDLMEFLHQHGVKGYVTFNTLIFTSELPDAVAQLRLLERSGVDAVIVQDLGLARLVKALTPRLRLHASTQMTLTSPEGLELAKGLAIDQAVLARELSLRELEKFNALEAGSVPLEVFVHGALCVAYSGQCLTSESLGRRSANRGECAQACRMPYEMVVDGELKDLGDKRYLLSPQDLAAVDEVPKLIELGIRSFKIEGRLKTPEYVAAVTRAYRKAIDLALEGRDVTTGVDAGDRYAMEMTFSRGLFSGWMHGVNHQKLVGAEYGKKRGPMVGTVIQVERDAVELDGFAVAMKPGDGVVFENLSDTNYEQGGRVFQMEDHWLGFQREKLRMRDVKVGMRVYKTGDPALDRSLRQTFEGDIPLRKLCRLDVVVRGGADTRLRLSVKPSKLKGSGPVPEALELESAMDLQTAQKRPLTEGTLRDQLGRLGGTPFELGSILNELQGDVMLPVSELNRMRRAMVAQLEVKAVAAPAEKSSSSETLAAMLGRVGNGENLETEAKQGQLIVLCRTRPQVDAALAAGVRRIYADFEDIRLYADLVTHVRAHGGSEIWLATPRIQKAGEAGFFKLIERANPHGVLIRNLGAIAYFRALGLPITGDFSLNVANPLTAEFLKGQGLERLTISYDLNFEQVVDLLRGAPPAWFELTLHQHMPMFHMEHCAFAAFLSDGTDFTNCGRPCEKHRVVLRDRVGMEHPLKADVGCRNTLFNAVAQTGAEFFETMIDVGLRAFRVELLEEDAAETAKTLEVYGDLLEGRRSGREIWRALRARSQLGVTRGTLAELSGKLDVSSETPHFDRL